jgi:RNA polymerase sigma-70 factor (ECF subfamily)
MPPDFARLVDEQYQSAFRFAYSLCGNEADASDLTQQAFYLAQTRLHQLRDSSKSKSWLFTILHREFLRMRRREATRRNYDVELRESAETPTSVDQAQHIDAGRLMGILQSLDEHFRVPLSLFYVEQLSYKEIAAMIDIPIGTAMSRLARGKQLLRDLLERENRSEREKIVPMDREGAKEANE